MIEIDLGPTGDYDDDDARRYTDRNHLGRIISGGRYAFRLRGGRRSYAASLTSLLHVNHEARGAARSFYHVQLPLGAGQVLYLSPEYDVVYVRPWEPKSTPPGIDLPLAAVLVDFLHDARAFDYKDRGHVFLFSLSWSPTLVL